MADEQNQAPIVDKSEAGDEPSEDHTTSESTAAEAGNCTLVTWSSCLTASQGTKWRQNRALQDLQRNVHTATSSDLIPKSHSNHVQSARA
jgi:hypothetical protein